MSHDGAGPVCPGFIADLLMRAGGRQGEALARAVIVAIDSSTRRQVGASLIVDRTGVAGTLGGGGLEEAVALEARAQMDLAQGPTARWPRRMLFVPQGPILGEVAPGGVHVLVEAFGAAEIAVLQEHWGARSGESLLARPLTDGAPPLLLHDASDVVAPLPQLIERLRLAPDLSVALSAATADVGAWVVERVSAATVAFHIHGGGEIAHSLARVLAGTPFRPVLHNVAGPLPMDVARDAGAFHAVMTGSHEHDVEVCRQLLAANRFRYLGLIGSRLKRAGLLSRLAAYGIAPAVAQRVACPIGLAAVRGKEPAVIAIAVAAEAIALLRAR